MPKFITVIKKERLENDNKIITLLLPDGMYYKISQILCFFAHLTYIPIRTEVTASLRNQVFWEIGPWRRAGRGLGGKVGYGILGGLGNGYQKRTSEAMGGGQQHLGWPLRSARGR